MTKSSTTNQLFLGFEPGNRNSVLTVINPNSTKEKTAMALSTYAPFDTGQTFRTQPGSGSVDHEGKLWLVGSDCDGHEGSFTFTSIDKYTDTDGLRILLKSLLSQLLPQGKTKTYIANLAMGMPSGWMNEDLKESVIETISGTHEISGNKHHGFVTIKPEKISFYHEPVGAYAYLRTANSGLEIRKTCNLLDIGFDTTDTFSFENGAIVKKKTFTIDGGMFDLYSELQTYFQAKEMGNIEPIRYWEAQIMGYKPNGNHSPVDKIVLAFIKDLTNKVSQQWKGIRNKRNLGLIGGGGAFFNPILNAAGIETLEIEYPQLINSKGLAILAQTSR